MRILFGLPVLLALGVLIQTADAQPSGGPRGRGGPRGGDRAAWDTPPAFAQIGGDFRGGPDGPGDRGPRDRELGPRGEGDFRRGDGPVRPGAVGPPMRNLEPLFAWFDNNGDALLDRQEFGELSQFVRRKDGGPNRAPLGPRSEPGIGPPDRDPGDEPMPAFRRGRGQRGEFGPPGEGRGNRRGRGRRGGPRGDMPPGDAPEAGSQIQREGDRPTPSTSAASEPTTATSAAEPTPATTVEAATPATSPVVPTSAEIPAVPTAGGEE